MTKYYLGGPSRCQHCMSKLFYAPDGYPEDAPESKYCSKCLVELYPNTWGRWLSNLAEQIKDAVIIGSEAVARY